MMTKIKLSTIILLMLSVFHMTDSENLRDLTYSGSEIYSPPISTPQSVTSTTKKSSILSGIKKFFGRESSSTETAQISKVISTPSPNPIQRQTNRDYINPSYRPGSTGINNNNFPIDMPSSSTPNPLKSVSTVNNINNNNKNHRDYVNPNAYIIPTSPKNPFINGPSSQQQSDRDYINKPSPPKNSQFNPGSSSFPSIPKQQQPSSSRDYINPNFPLPSSSPANNGNFNLVTPSTNSMPKQQPNRDYVNPNYPNPLNPSKNSPLNPVTPSISSSSNRDYTNARISSSTSPTFVTSSNPGIFNEKDFPALPNQPQRGRTSTTHRPQIPQVSTPKQNELATDEELSTLTETLFSKDINNQNKNVIIHYQGKTRSHETDDQAPQPFLEVNDEALQSPTISKMRLLYNNYELDTTVNEYVTAIERQEENDFIDAVLKTQVMRQAMLFLQNKGIVTPDPRTHRDLLKMIWFTLYSRGGGRIGSSAFEHVFLNEVKNGTITGLHNWIYFYEQERQGHIDYKGYIKSFELGNKGAIVKFRFEFNGIMKPVNAMFIGTSPELEMALYTVCFQVRPDKDCPITLNGNKFNMKTYTFRYRGKSLIGSAYPEI